MIIISIIGFAFGRPSTQPESSSRKLQRIENRQEMELFPIGKSWSLLDSARGSRDALENILELRCLWIFLFIGICLFKQRESCSLGL